MTSVFLDLSTLALAHTRTEERRDAALPRKALLESLLDTAKAIFADIVASSDGSVDGWSRSSEKQQP